MFEASSSSEPLEISSHAIRRVHGAPQLTQDSL